MIIRAEHQTHFTVLRNSTLRDSRLTFRARGLLAYLLSLPEDARVGYRDLELASGEGQYAIREALKELARCGYLERSKVRGPHGRWRSEVVVRELSTDASEPTSTVRGKPPHGPTCEKEPKALVAPCVDSPRRDNPRMKYEVPRSEETLISKVCSDLPTLALEAAEHRGDASQQQQPPRQPRRTLDPLAQRLVHAVPACRYDQALACVGRLRDRGVGDVLIDEAIGFTLERANVRSLRFVEKVALDWMLQRDPAWAGG